MSARPGRQVAAKPRPPRHPACVCACTCRPTAVELAALALAAAGLTNGKIAAELGCATRSVENRLSSLRVRVGARDRAHLVAIGFRDDLIGFDQDGRVVVVDEVAS